MDDNIVRAIIEKKGADPTNPENANRVREFASRNPDVLERYAMGSGGQFEDNSGLLQLIARQVDQTMGVQPQVQEQAPQQTMPSVQNASIPTRKSATAAPVPTDINTGYGPNFGPLPPRDASPGEQGAVAPQSDNLWQWLLPALGLGALRQPMPNGGAVRTGLPTEVPLPDAQYVGPMQRQGQQDPRARGYFPQNNNPQLEAPNARLEAPQGRIGSNVGPNQESVGAEMETVRNRNASAKAGQERAVQADVDAENQRSNDLQEQIRKRITDQERTEALARQARRATGRK